MTTPLVILSPLEQERLLHAIEAALAIADPRRLFLWTQGQFQALLPHQVMVCLHLAPDGRVARVECLHGQVLAPALIGRLSDPRDGLTLRLARHWRQAGALPRALEAAAPDAPAPPPFQAELRACGYDNVLLHGSAPLAGGASFFALFGMPLRPGAREAHFLKLLLPYLHMALLGLDPSQTSDPHDAVGSAAPGLMRPVSLREVEILRWVREGKSNQEVGQILGISGLTVKNHLQRIYRALGVNNRTQAVTRGTALRLLDGGTAMPC